MPRSAIYLNVIMFFITCLQAQPQFWKMSAMSDKDLFIFDVKSTMSSGICYKQVKAKANDPELRIRTISFCCTGYKRSPLSPHSVKCDPICTEDCSNGICSAPDTCECFPSFQRRGGRCETSTSGLSKISCARKRGTCSCCKSKCDSACIICSKFI